MKTSDVYLASALLALKYKLTNIDRTNPKHMIFEFGLPESPTPELSTPIVTYNLANIETQWANRTLIVNGWDFAEAIKRMKSLIHSG